MRTSTSLAGALAGLASLSTLACASPITLAARNNDAAGSPSVSIKNGTVEGVSLPTFSQEAFLGIPFAQPPVGDLRLRRPHSLEKGFEDGSFSAKKYSPFCPGIGADDYGYELSEDCLTVNVLRPAGTSADDKLPVGFWIYGGGFEMGGNADIRYNGSYAVQRSVEMDKPIIYVQVNYRVSSLGFLSSNELRAEGNLNLGLYDQRLALHWVKENIAAFGGDPDKVTIWGESAGAMSVSHQLLGWGLDSTDLFRGAILESGSSFTSSFADPEILQPRFDEVAKNAGCGDADDVLKCLRGVSLDTFNSSAAAYSWSPVVDGGIIPAFPSDIVKNGSFVKVPLLIGANTDEGTAFGSRGINTTEQLAADLATRYSSMQNSSVDKVLELYPNDPLVGCPYGSGDAVLPSGLQDKRSFSIYGDLTMHAGRRRLAELYSAAGAPVYSYRFDQPAENATIETGTTHFVEVAYVFGVPYKTANTLGTRPGDAELSHLVMSQWISFIHDGTPNNHGIADAPEWPDYRTSPSNYVYRRHGSVVETDDYRKEGIAYINQLDWEIRV
ncbi:uncharacterized protein RHOBADRAFT_47745 [Rhodotorula graminis WP1]|uniref:Carboxylic ester hydrolase n=1 Tax=Rhodotorula graminis (strain WP1) TaxID=578459 RepID=A0A0P9IQ43_RHOGW|nr:uncharacterized protein RHOBADRAFT_47745 [Rhodotorula graminis WP1]KPV71564.1 hypothetical protein RHOBADRAFT_47745 [Rhodotorula graminis WP1]